MKKQIILVLGLLIVGALPAQEKGSYIDFNVGGGLHNLSYSLLNGTEKTQAGYTLNAGYTYFFTSNWGIHTGLGIQTFNSMSTLNYLSNTQDIDADGQTYQFKANYTNYQEKQQAILIDIPLAIQYRFPLNEKIGLLASIGAMMALPVKSSFKTFGGGLVTTGYYSQWNVELSDMPQHGFSTMTNSFTGNTTLKTSYMGIADMGGLFKMSQRLDLYVGGYINYGLNNVLTPDSKLIYQPNGVYNGILASSQTNNVTPISFGVKIGVYFHLGKHTSLNENEKSDKSTESVQTKEQLNLDDSQKTTTEVSSTTVVVKEVVTQQFPKDTKQNTATNPSNSTILTGKPTVVLPISSSNSGGKDSKVQPGAATGSNGRLNQGQTADSLKTFGSVNSKTVVVKERTTSQTSKVTGQNNASSFSNPTLQTGKPTAVLPISSSNGGKNSKVQPGTSTGSNGRLYYGQTADSLKTSGSVNSKTVVVKERTTSQTSKVTGQNNASSFSNPTLQTGKPTAVLPISSSNGGKNSKVQPGTSTGSNGRLYYGQTADSLKTSGSVNSKTVVVKERSTIQTSQGTGMNTASGLSNIPVQTGNPTLVVPVSSLNGGGENSQLQADYSSTQRSQSNQGQPTDLSGTTNSANPEYAIVTGSVVNNSPREKSGFFKSIFSRSSHSKGKLNKGQTTDPTNPTGNLIQGQSTDSLSTTNSVNPTNDVLTKGEAKQTPKGIRKFIKNILTKSSGQKGKINYPLPSDSFNPSGSINSIRQADSLNTDGQFYTGQLKDPFERAKKIASSMNQWFDFDSFEITNANNNHTKELSDILKANPNMLLVFVGYTCNIGTQVINIKLGMKRVETVIQKFLDQGVPESQLIGESKGYDEPLVPNTSAENRAKNRRVEINVIKDN